MNDELELELEVEISFNDYLGCTEEFDIKSSICTKHCSISMRCIIENNRSMQLELMDELMLFNDKLIRIQ